MRIATLAVGYADGLRRELSGKPAGNGGWVIIRGQPCPVLGRISMNLTVVDITHLGDVEPGTPATILGVGITADDHAALAKTIPYEILCGVHPGVVKVW
jgi:alanine racemase